jgi:predicted dehydrogenase
MKTLAELGLPTNIPLPRRRDWRLGVIGLGGISGAHLPAYREAGWRVVAGCDIDPARRAEAQARHGVEKVSADFLDVIHDPEVEVISLLTQPNIREEVVAACAAAGKPVQVEKPLANDVATAERMVALAQRAGIALGVSQNYRWFPACFAASGLISGGWIGKPYLATIEIHGTQDDDLATHPFYAACTDFLTVQWNTHLADLIRGWMGADPVRVLARTSRREGQNFRSDNLLVSVIDYGRGGTGTVLHSELHRGGLASNRVRIEGDSGTLEFPLWHDQLTVRSNRLGKEPVQVQVRPEGFLPSMCGPMADFLRSIEERREPTVSGRRNLATLRQVLAEQQSSLAGGTWIDLAP